MTYFGIDFEFTRNNEPHPRPCCAALLREGDAHAERHWLLDDPAARATLADRVRELHAGGAVFVAYAAGAECRCMLALGVEPTGLRWIDLHLEHRLLVNWSRHRYGLQWVRPKGGRWAKKRTRPPAAAAGYGHRGRGRPRRTSPDRVFDADGNVVDSAAPVCSLVNARLRFLNADEDPGAKDAMRALVLLDKSVYSGEERAAILDYCANDVADLHDLREAMTRELRRLLPPRQRGRLDEHQLGRGRWAADVSRVEQVGIPIDVDGVQRLSGNVDRVIEEARDEASRLWPFWEADRRGGHVFRYHKFAELVELKGLAGGWPLTETGRFKSDEETLAQHRAVPELEAPRQARKTERQVAWYRPDALPEFLQHVGDDGRLRPYYGPMGTQTGRNAAKAKTFLPAQSKWLRCLIRPDPGTVIISADYQSQEFLIAAVLSGDRRMREAYASGDVYLAFGKAAGMVPAGATKHSHGPERRVCKEVVLGTQYGMGAASLATTLTHASGRAWRERQAERLLDQHRRVYGSYWGWVDGVRRGYLGGEPLVQPDGWALWCENPNLRSACNFPVQARGAVILRDAVRRLHDAGVRVAWPLRHKRPSRGRWSRRGRRGATWPSRRGRCSGGRCRRPTSSRCTAGRSSWPASWAWTRPGTRRRPRRWSPTTRTPCGSPR